MKCSIALRIASSAALVGVLGIGMTGCSSDRTATPSDNSTTDDATAVDSAKMSDAVATYADGVHASYTASVASATDMDAAIDAFIAAPSSELLDVAIQKWLTARDDYGPTEAFRFYGGPIDDEETGIEGLVNAWPLDEAYIDYVEGMVDAGIINNPNDVPSIDANTLLSLNEEGGEANISTGWHAIEFLLWGQDLSETGPGERPVSDYTDAPNADRRSQYLTVVSDLLVTHLSGLVEEWAPATDNFRKTFESMDTTEALRMMITGIGELSRGELAGERLNVAYAERSQEDEHSCFSDNTTSDIVANAMGIYNVLNADYPGGVEGTSVLDLVSSVDETLSAKLADEVSTSVEAAKAIPAPFDQHLTDSVSDDDPGRASILTEIELLEEQTDTIVLAASALGVTVDVT